MEERNFFDIVMPFYNRADLAERCIQSLKEQKFNSFRVLMVFDGGESEVLHLLQKTQQEDKRFVLVQQEHGGVSACRNAGLNLLNSQYVMFCDSDDTLIPDALSRCAEMVRKNTDCDWFVSDFFRVKGQQIYTMGSIDTEGIIDRTDYCKYMMKQPADFYYGVLWNKIYHTDIIRQQNLKFSLELNWCEDFQFNLEYLAFVQKIYISKRPFYFYYKNKGSIVNSAISLQKVVQTKSALFDYYKALYEQLDLYEDNKLKINMFFLASGRDKVIDSAKIRFSSQPIVSQAQTLSLDALEKTGQQLQYRVEDLHKKSERIKKRVKQIKRRSKKMQKRAEKLKQQ